MSLDILKEHIKSNKFKNLYLFYGHEEYLKKLYLESIENKIIGGNMRDMNKIVMEGKVDIGKLADNCETVPLFSERKLVLVKNSGIFKASKKSDSEKTDGKKDNLAMLIQSVPSYTCLIFIEEEIDKRLKVIDIIKKNGLIVEFAFQKPPELVKWVIKLFRAKNKNISNELASVIVNNCDQGMVEIHNEVEKLILFLGNKETVSPQDVEKVCTKSIKSRIFDLTDAIAAKDRTKAYIILEEMVVLKEPMPKILYMIARQFNQLLSIKLLTQVGANINDAAAKIGVSPYIAGKIMKQSKEFELNLLKKVVEESLELDVAVKTGRINDRVAVEMLLAGIN
ncbi:DNA polymerase III, delta subunit [Pseudobacteroides cellulosolvens ATCC 35603 = DSM 2933]|uniref:DNA polymerase III subunit delta n=2 Tax=Pseudobacteroides cellulosolvens TaxID=35825 RepID=A0A0L6JH81_9FIRM|nr:DNA polymerase III, delta subunit [Pseudobacteroides cellulosolvens ATCC 35603 = DSM 2933]